MSDTDDVLGRINDLAPEHVAAGVTDADDTLELKGAVDTTLAFASVTKPLAAYATLIAVQDGSLHLDEPVSVDGAPPGITVRHLLAHASGLPPDAGGPIGEPGKRRIYSNWGYDVLGDLVVERVGLPFAEHLELEVLRPLGMADTKLEGSPAHGASGTVVDLLAFARELLDPDLLDAELHREATTIAFPGLDGVVPGFGRHSPNDWGLGFELKGDKDPHWTGDTLSPATFGHFGRSGSFLWIDPERGVGSAFLADLDFDVWAAEAWPALTDAVIEAYGRGG